MQNTNDYVKVTDIAKFLGYCVDSVKDVMKSHGIKPDYLIGHNHAVTKEKAFEIAQFVKAEKKPRNRGKSALKTESVTEYKPINSDSRMKIREFCAMYKEAAGDSMDNKTVSLYLEPLGLIDTGVRPMRIMDEDKALTEMLKFCPARGTQISFPDIAENIGIPVASVRGIYSQHQSEFSDSDCWEGAAFYKDSERRGHTTLFSQKGADKLADIIAGKFAKDEQKNTQVEMVFNTEQPCEKEQEQEQKQEQNSQQYRMNIGLTADNYKFLTMCAGFLCESGRVSELVNNIIKQYMDEKVDPKFIEQVRELRGKFFG
jgi:hypothetical protein